jgi:hypothetical protein
MAKTHGPGRHQYLVARDVMEADVVVNLPKLKTHKKAGMTCALKNLIGINGNKEYLPHHRIHGYELGGDCYPGHSRIKMALEYVLDRQNGLRPGTRAKVWTLVARVLNRLIRLTGNELGIEGSWSGNDTIWRTCLDLNRILLYGRSDGRLANEPQRTVFHVVDALVAGQGDGPLSPQPLPLHLLFAGGNAAAVDWIGAQLLRFDPRRIPIVREAFGSFRWPLVSFRPEDVTLLGDIPEDAVPGLLQTRRWPKPAHYPPGWRDCVWEPGVPGPPLTRGSRKTMARSRGE